VGLKGSTLSVKLLGGKMTYMFYPPTVEEGPAGYNVLHYRYKLTRGVTVIKENGVYRETRFPFVDELNDADLYYLGGHEYEVDATEKAALEAAGYEVVTI
jgi:hypothetical protein